MRPLHKIAAEIRREWKKPYFGAVPYIEALGSMESAKESYGFDPGESIVLYFLSNANTFRGPVAKRVKAELKEHAGIKLSKVERETLVEYVKAQEIMPV